MQTQVTTETYKRRKKAYKFGEKPEGVEILKNVTLLSSNKKQEENFNRLVYISHILCLDVGVLLPHANKLRESCKETFDSDSRHVHILSGYKHYKIKNKKK